MFHCFEMCVLRSLALREMRIKTSGMSPLNTATDLIHSYIGGLMSGRLHTIDRVRAVSGFVLQDALGLRQILQSDFLWEAKHNKLLGEEMCVCVCVSLCRDCCSPFC